MKGVNGLIGGHAVIVVEGLKDNGQPFQGEYDITANSFPEEQDNVQSMLGNVTGYITKIRCNPTADVRQCQTVSSNFHRDYFSLKSRNWYVKPELAIEMIVSIEKDSQILETEINAARVENRDISWPFKYQKAGGYRWDIWGGNGGDNCVTWAEKKLAIANVGNGKKVFDFKKASPALHIDFPSCRIL